MISVTKPLLTALFWLWAVIVLHGCQTSHPSPSVAYLPLTHQLPKLTLVAFTDKGWTKAEVEAWAQKVPPRLKACGIHLNAMNVIKTSQIENLFKYAAAHHTKGALMLFTDTTGKDSYGHHSAGVTVFPQDQNAFSLIARVDSQGRPLHPEQVVIHELAHQMGLRHVPKKNPDGSANINLMHPRGCLYCGFTKEQCSALQASKLVQKL